MARARRVVLLFLSFFPLYLISGCWLSNGNLLFNERYIKVIPGNSRELVLTLSGSTGVTRLPVAIKSSNTSVATVYPAACRLSSEPGSPQSCEVYVEGVADGVAWITATAPGYSPTTVLVSVSTSASVPGTLAFDQSSIDITNGSNNYLTLTLNGSSGVSGLVVTITSSNTSAVTMTTTTCTLSSGSLTARSCDVYMNGVSLGTSTITASATGYNSITAQANVISTPVPGTLTFSTTTVDTGISATQDITLSLNHSSGITGLIASLSSANTSIATVSPASCTLSSGQGIHSCTVAITGVAIGNTTVSATATGYTVTPVDVVVTQHHVPTSRFAVHNNCGFDVWMQAENPPTASEEIVYIAADRTHDYAIDQQYLQAFRIWPKTGCDANGNNCNTGQQIAPCPAAGCQPPIDSLWEGTFNDPGNGNATSYDTSLVNGYTLAFNSSVVPGSGETSNTCLDTTASTINVNNCPRTENLSVAGSSGAYGAYGFGPYNTYTNGSGNLVILTSVDLLSDYPAPSTGQGCMAPTTAMTYSTTYGGLFLGANSSGYTASLIDPVILYSCGFNTSQLQTGNPSPAVIQPGQQTGFNNLSAFCNATTAYCPSSDSQGPAASQVCNIGPINDTQYVQYIHANTTNIYAQTFDDTNGNLTCNSSTTKFTFTLCP